MNTRSRARAAALLAASLTLAFFTAGCQTTGLSPSRVRAEDTNPAITLRATKSEMYSGETITILAVTRNTLGRNPRIEWSSTWGTLTPDPDGTKARLKAEQPGKVTVRANLIMGTQIISDMVTVNVRPLP